MEKAASDLKFLMNKEDVDEELQVHIFHAGIVTVRTFAALAADTADMRKVLAEEFKLTTEGGGAGGEG